MNTFQYSANGFAMTKAFEGLRLTAYQDVAGIWTIGYGHTGADVKPGQAITEADAEQLLHQDLQAAIDCVNKAVTVPQGFTQNMFDALVDFAFNAGRGALLSSTLLRMLNLGNFQGAAAQFVRWVHAGDDVVPGLVRRRKAEADLFLTACPAAAA